MEQRKINLQPIQKDEIRENINLENLSKKIQPKMINKKT
jgi:hypothetical protein